MMTEANSITWSSYETHKIQIESELRWKIAEVIEQKINRARTIGMSNHFISGLEVCKSAVLGLDDKNEVFPEHPALF